MLIENNNSKNNKQFKDVEPGSCFSIGNGLFIKLAYEIKVNDVIYNCLNLKNGHLGFCGINSLVDQIDQHKIVNI